jgi:Tetratricopeptide repeat/FG-GAP repeat/FG-GAP-like repeat
MPKGDRATGAMHRVRASAAAAIAVFVIIALALPTRAAESAAPPAPGLSEASAKLQQGDFAGAIPILEAVTARTPDDLRAWRLLAYSYLKQKDTDHALAAYGKVLTLDPGNPAALYNVGVVHALRGEKDLAFEWLRKAASGRKVDMTQIETDPDLASLKEDPRFAALLPGPDEFANPFVEPVKILREWDGERAGDQFGWIARPMGDIDGDGVSDVVTSAPTSSAGGANAGRVYVYSTRTGELIWSVDGRPSDQLGLGVECAGDANGDGTPDVIASAPGGGKAYVYSGKDGQVLLTLHAEGEKDNFGRHVATVGDVDHDGHDDVVVGAPGNGAGGAGAGRAYVFSGKNGAKLLTLTGERAGDAFGTAVAGATIRGKSFIIVGAPKAGPNRTGRAYVYTKLSTKPRFVVDSDATGAALGGMFLSVVGDVDGDGVPDVYVSDFTNAARGPSTGRVYVYSGRTRRLLRALTGETAGEGFGIGPAAAGDIDGDGRADLVVGAWQYAGAAGSGGRAYLYGGADGRLMATFTCKVPGDTFGFDAVGLGDTDGDGTKDLLITSAWSGVHGFHSGRVFVISSGIRSADRKKDDTNARK